MRVLAVYAHPDPRSFCKAVLVRFTAGLREAHHDVEVVDLYAARFDQIFRLRNLAVFADDSVPIKILESTQLRKRLLKAVLRMRSLVTR